MVFKPKQSGNPSGRPKHVDPRSQDLQAFCREHKLDIQRVGEIALGKAVKDQEPWAIKLCMEYFYPKPGTFVAISRQENTEVSLKIESFVNALPFEDQQTFLKLWMKSKKGIPAFSAADMADEKSIDDDSTINNLNDDEFIVVDTDSGKPD